MPRALMADKDCWLQLMSLDPVTGLDPGGTRLRGHEGLDGVDFFVPVRSRQRRSRSWHCVATTILGLCCFVCWGSCCFAQQ